MLKGANVHGPVAVGECDHCHEAHESNEKRLLKGKMKDVCLVCHAEFGRQMKEAAVVHAPVQLDTCNSCHMPHATDNKFLLKKPLPDLCIGCHVKIANKHNDSKVKHKPLVQTLGCSGCHSSHFAPAKGLIPGDEKTMCLNCHGGDTQGTMPLKNMTKEMAGKKFLHGPIQKNRCAPCHDPHGSNNYRLLKGNYPAELYTPYRDDSFSFCLTCHEKDMLRYPETTVYTKFRNGKRNLHYVHVANKRKGRSCKVCHDIHASNGERLISPEGAPFGEWMIPLRFKMTRTGGSCAPGCHRPFDYDREKPADYITEPQK
jgi:predicted CXXCH cytochrome family protein